MLQLHVDVRVLLGDLFPDGVNRRRGRPEGLLEVAVVRDRYRFLVHRNLDGNNLLHLDGLHDLLGNFNLHRLDDGFLDHLSHDLLHNLGGGRGAGSQQGQDDHQ